MQPLFDKLKALLQGNLLATIGFVLLGLLILQGVALVFLYLRRIWYEREHQRLSRERLRLQVQTAAIQCRHGHCMICAGLRDR